MNKLKSYFVTSFMIFLMVSLVYSIVQLILNGIQWTWVIILAQTLAPLFFFGKIMQKKTATTSKNLWPWTLLTGIGLLGVFILLFINGLDSLHLPFYISVLVTFSWLLYVYWYSNLSPRDRSILTNGQQIPNVSLQNLEGNSIKLYSVLRSPAVLLFYRGNWCPFCMAQVKELAQKYQDIKNLGAQIIFISSQHGGHTKQLARSLNIDAEFLLDSDLSAAKKLGIFHESGTPLGINMMGYTSDTVLPTVVITDADKIIRYSDLTSTYRIRPYPEDFISILQKL